MKNIDEVVANGKNVGRVWKKSFCLDITEALKSGRNIVQAKVTNLWVNPLIGDVQPEPVSRSDGTVGGNSNIAFTALPFYRADSPLLPSGLLGPVRIRQAVFTDATADTKR